VGVVDEPSILDGSKIRVGDAVLGIASSGVHSNGFSLVRKVLFEKKGYTVESHMAELGKSLGAELLTPTKIYVKPVLDLLANTGITGLVHITGGGFPGNIPRVLPEMLAISIRKGSWEIPPIFDILSREAGLDDDEMFRTFNMGVGMVATISPSHIDTAIECLKAHNTKGWIIGNVVSRPSHGQSISIS
jgi:phosphoribosylformylglycinamidine cyclo-ligase